ncbi:BrnT family toxin [Polycyclovorans algicola]|uniref:BrnT family toxin n=1 Tax=Polycyclovorans algicola TaxID=616992 RepID=UPI0004A6E811|nr:BrnT family toxin [Polycyclovorans algicola]
MKIEFDPEKRDKTLTERGLDFARTAEVFAGHHLTAPDLRESYGEDRYITLGLLDGRMVVTVWTPRGEARRIISMRKANEREQARYRQKLGRP